MSSSRSRVHLALRDVAFVVNNVCENGVYICLWLNVIDSICCELCVVNVSLFCFSLYFMRVLRQNVMKRKSNFIRKMNTTLCVLVIVV